MGRQLAQGMSWAELYFGKGTLAASWRSRDKDRLEVETGDTQQNEVRTKWVWDSGEERRQKRGFS